MSGRTAGAANGAMRTRWGAVALGWALAVLVGVVASFVFRYFYGFFSQPRLDPEVVTATSVVTAVVSGFLSYLAGGYAAAKVAGYSGGKHGAMTAVLGLIVGIILVIIFTLFGIVFAEGVAVPPANFGVTSVALVSGAVLFLINLFGGYVGGKLGEPFDPAAEYSGSGWLREKRR